VPGDGRPTPEDLIHSSFQTPLFVMESNKKEYSAPELREWGSVADLTGDGYEYNGSPNDVYIPD
jgi:hypothetical protein